MRRLVVLSAIALPLMACGSGGGGNEVAQVAGTFTILDSGGYERVGGDCGGVGGYSDLQSNTAVTVEAADTGDRVARTTLGLGAERVQRGGVTVCEFNFSFEVSESDDADGAGFVVNIGERGSEQYSFTELQQNPNAVELSIG